VLLVVGFSFVSLFYFLDDVSYPGAV